MEQIGKDFDIVLKMSSPLDIPKRMPEGFQLSSSPTRSFPGSPGRFFQIPSPIITKRTRTHSQSERARSSPLETGKIKYFSRHKGHGYITRDNGESEIFVHVSDIEGEYVPREGDEVSFRLCPIPPKNERFQAVHVNIIDVQREPHERWNVLPLSGSHHD